MSLRPTRSLGSLTTPRGPRFTRPRWWPRRNETAGEDRPDRPWWRVVAAWVATGLASLLVLFALVAPNRIGHLTPGEFVRIPVEALVLAALVLVLPPRARRVVAALIGVALGVLTILKVVDMGFYRVLDRPFEPVGDWSLLGSAAEVIRLSVGRAGEIGAVIGAAVVAAAVLALMALSVLRLSRLAAVHRTGTVRAVAVLGLVWVLAVVLGVRIVPNVPVASDSAAALAYDRARQVRADLKDRHAFREEVAVDAYRDTPAADLLTGLRGKDVIVAFVESYGRVAIEDPAIAPGVDEVLDTAQRRLSAAGFGTRSAFLTSPTAGGGSWLAHSTLLSGLWIRSQQRYRELLSTDRLTLNGAFKRAGWRTVGVMPGTSRPWPDGQFYGYDKLYIGPDLGYQGPTFNFSSIPDQYTLEAFQRAERATPNHAPLMAEIALLSSHGPWAPLPEEVDWASVGDGSVFEGVRVSDGSPQDVLRDRATASTAYGHSIEYSLETLLSYVERYGDGSLVLVFLGDHQPAPIVTGEGASRDVPVTIVARDPAVLARISGWGWQDGLRPGTGAPVWRMDTFRDRFLAAFGPRAGSHP